MLMFLNFLKHASVYVYVHIYLDRVILPLPNFILKYCFVYF